MAQRLHPTVRIHAEIGTDGDRVKFLNGIASELSAKMNLFIDTDRLLKNVADGHAVEELLKVVGVLHEAVTLAEEMSSSEEEFQPEETIRAAKNARSLVKEIKEISSRLSQMLKNEGEDSKEKDKVLRFLNSSSDIPRGDDSGEDGIQSQRVEEQLRTILGGANSSVERLDKQCKILVSNQRGMEEKIRKKTIDLERTSKRMESLRHIRPAYMDEYEQLEEELQVEYERYVVLLRNVDYLKGELSSFEQSAVEKQNIAERSMKRMQKKFREEEQRILAGGEDSV